MNRGERLQRVLEWLKDAGAEGLDRVRLSKTVSLKDVSSDPLCEEEYACFVTDNVPMGSCVLRVPLICLISVEMGMATTIGERILRHELETGEVLDLTAPKHCFLALFLLTDRRDPQSWYQPYYNSLPATFPNIPLFWDMDDIATLRGCHLLYLVKDRLENLEADYQVICSVAPQFSEVCTVAEWVWARMVVASRNFGVEIEGMRTDVLCPLCDMLNHRRPRQTKWQFDQASESFVVEATVDLDAGAELLDSYGRKCNTRYLLNYGFCVQDNRDPDGRCYNELRIFVALDPRDRALQLKRCLAAGVMYRTTRGAGTGTVEGVFSLGEHSEIEVVEEDEEEEEEEDEKVVSGGASSARPATVFGKGVRISMHHDDPSSREALSLARFACASSERGRHSELAALPLLSDLDLNSVDDFILPISRDNEADVLELVGACAREQLARYGSRAEAEQVGSGGEGATKFKNVRQMFAQWLVAGECEVCRYWLRCEELLVPLLRHKLPRTARKQALDLAESPELDLPYCALRRYILDVVLPLLEME